MHDFGLPGAALGDGGSSSRSSSSSGERAIGRVHAETVDAAADADPDEPLTKASLRAELERFAQGSLLAELRAVRDDVLRACGAEVQRLESLGGDGSSPLLPPRGGAADAAAPEVDAAPSSHLFDLRPITPDAPAPLLPLSKRPNGDTGFALEPSIGAAAWRRARVQQSPPSSAPPTPPSPARLRKGPTRCFWNGSLGSRESRPRGTALSQDCPSCQGDPDQGSAGEQDSSAPEAAEWNRGRRNAIWRRDRSRLHPPPGRSKRRGEVLDDERPLVAWGSPSSLRAKDVLESHRFDTAISFIIALNAVTIGLEADFQARHLTQEVPRVLGSTSPYRALDLIFSLVFMGELALRLYVHRVGFLIKREAAVLWNWFDLAVVLVQLLQDAITLLAVTSSSAVDVSSMRLLRVLRVLKVLRIVRIVPLFAELRRIVSSIMGSFKSLGWTMALLFLMMYIVGIFFVQLITDHLVEREGEGLTERELVMRKYFGSLPDAWMSLWKAISGGIDWDILAEPLEKDVGSLLGWAFAAYIAFALLALMNVVTGVFVQTALQSAQQEEDSFLTDQIIALLSSTDAVSLPRKDGRALVTMNDIQSRLRDPRFEKDWKAINVTQDEAEYIFELLDVTRCGEILVDDFVAACIRLHGGAKSIDVLTMMQENRHNSRRLEEVFTSTFELTDDVRGLQEGQRQLAHALEEQRRSLPSAGLGIRRSLGKLEATASASALRMAALEEQLGSVDGAVKSVLRRSGEVHLLEALVETFVSGGGRQAGTGGSEAHPGKATPHAPMDCDEEV